MTERQPAIIFTPSLTAESHAQATRQKLEFGVAQVKKFHHKSRTGCDACRSRRVKVS